MHTISSHAQAHGTQNASSTCTQFHMHTIESLHTVDASGNTRTAARVHAIHSHWAMTIHMRGGKTTQTQTRDSNEDTDSINSNGPQCTDLTQPQFAMNMTGNTQAAQLSPKAADSPNSTESLTAPL